MLHDGEICHAQTAGTELARFSVKGHRLVVLAAQNEDTAFVYPLTTKRGEAKWLIERIEGRCWVVPKQLYAVPSGRLTTAGDRWTRLHHHRALILRHLADREEAALKGDYSPRLVHQPLMSLREVPRESEPRPKPRVEGPATGDPFLDYLDAGGVERDLREGRHRDR